MSDRELAMVTGTRLLRGAGIRSDDPDSPGGIPTVVYEALRVLVDAGWRKG